MLRSILLRSLTGGAILAAATGVGSTLAADKPTAAPSKAALENWPEFRGPRGDGIATAKDLPITWSETENIKWKTPVHGKGWSSPVIWGSQIWLTTATADGKELSAVCLDRETGKVLYDLLLFKIASPAPLSNSMNSYASPSPVIEAGRVYVHWGSAGTACLDTKTGKTVWARQDLPCNHWRGPGSSPILFGKLLVLTFDGFDLQYLAALDKETGDTVWRTDRNIDYGSDDGDGKKGYSTPRVIDVAGQLQMVSPSAGATIAYHPDTGKEIWRVRSGGMNAAARPLFGNGLVYCTTAAGGWQLFAVNPQGQGDVSNQNVAWKSSKSVPTRSSPLLVDDLIFMSNDSGVLSCVDAKTGEGVWQKRVEGGFTASPILADGRIYFCGEGGEMPVIEPAREFNVLATNKLDDGFMASPAALGKSLFFRSRTHVYRIEK